MIRTKGFTHSRFNFPCGEMHVKILTVKDVPLSIVFEFEKNEDIIELLLVCDAVKRIGRTISELEIPYVPFSRQDRVAVEGECFSLHVFAGLINGLGIKKVTVIDPHSDVSSALINNVVIVKQHNVFYGLLKNKRDLWLVSPDAGALKKTYQLADRVKTLGVIECSKRRDVRDGKIIGAYIPQIRLHGKDCYIVDDICDGGRTFIEIARELKTRDCGRIILLVTHGFFTKGLKVFDGLIDQIYTLKGRVK